MMVLSTPSRFFSAALLLSNITQFASASLLELLPRAVQTTVVATVTVQPASVTSVPDTTSYTNANNLQADILNSTNFYRYEHNATALSWNASLASYAQSWASRCQWQHSGGPYGENLASGYPDVTDAVDGWGNERAQYNFQQPTGFSEATGHFTQLVWKSTTSTGCAAVNCTGKGGMDGFFLVCEYYPPGNVVGENNAFFVQNVQSQIHTGGPTGTSSAVATSTVTTSAIATASASTTGQVGLGNEGTPGRAGRSLWTLAVLFVALVLAGSMI
jgi:recyclin-1